ncbi:MAG: Fic family protein [Actinomycetales bacterium]
MDFEVVEWAPKASAEMTSRRERLRHRGPYQAAVPPRIALLTPALPAALLAVAEDASNEIARFDSAMGAEIAPFASILLRSESAASSRIENLTASARAIAEAELGAGSRANAAEIVANVEAMTAAVSLSERIDSDAILRMHRALMQSTEPEIAGQWRTEQVWIGRSQLGPHDADFVPPRSTRIAEAIDDLMTFATRDDMPILPQVAVAHAQFETIHPFVDGNGRTGRALMQSMLRGKGLTRNVTVPVSAGLLVDTKTYFDALTAYRAGDLEPIVRRMSDAALVAVVNGRQLVEELREIRRSWSQRIRARSDSAVWRVCDLIITRPVIDARLISQELGISGNNVLRHLAVMERADVLVELTAKKRNRAWQSPEVLQALDSFAARAGRRVA